MRLDSLSGTVAGPLDDRSSVSSTDQSTSTDVLHTQKRCLCGELREESLLSGQVLSILSESHHVFDTTGSELGFVLPLRIVHLCRVALRVSDIGLRGPVVNCDGMLVIFTNREKLGTTGGELKSSHSSSVETSNLANSFAGGGSPDADIDELALLEHALVPCIFLVGSLVSELFGGHLPCGDDVSVGVQSHSDNVFSVLVVETLSLGAFVVDYAKASSCKHNISVFSVSQVVSSVERAETMSPLKLEVDVRFGTGRLRFDEVRRNRVVDLAEERLNSHGFITVVLLFVAEFIVSSLFLFVPVLILILTFLHQVMSVLVSLGILLVLPLEDRFILTTGRDQVLLTVISGLREADVGHVTGVTEVLLIVRFFLRAGVSEQLDLSKVVSCGDNGAIGSSLDGVNVSAVSARGPDALDRPAELATPRVPRLVFVVTGSTRDLLSTGSVPEEDLVVLTVRHERRAVLGEIKVQDSAVMASNLLKRLVPVEDIEQDDLTVGTTGGKF